MYCFNDIEAHRGRGNVKCIGLHTGRPVLRPTTGHHWLFGTRHSARRDSGPAQKAKSATP